MLRHSILAVGLLAPSFAQEQEPDLLELEPFVDSAGKDALRGVYRVRENRTAGTGPWLELDLVVLLATGSSSVDDPIFYLFGGPGGPATGAVGGFVDSPLRERRDIVFVDQRGTGGNHRLACPYEDTDPQSYLTPGFEEDHYRACLERLEAEFDLTQYTTPIAAHDLNEVRAALGYERVNLMGGSYGSRMALVTLREHPEMVRAAVLDGVAPISFTNPLFHAWAAQRGWDQIALECRSTPARIEAFGDLDAKFHKILERLEEEPAQVAVRDPNSGKSVTVTLTRDAFCEALRTLMYYTGGNRQVPDAVCKAYEGDYAPFAQRGLGINRALRQMLAMGMLLSVTCPEDLARIDPATIPRWTKGTFLGDIRVQRQMALCEFWPKGEVGEDYGEPVSVDVPTLLLSGTHDPVTPPEFGAAAAEHLPNSLHLVVPGCHGVGRSGCLPELVSAFLDAGSVEALDASCIESMSMPPFAVSGR